MVHLPGFKLPKETEIIRLFNTFYKDLRWGGNLLSITSKALNTVIHLPKRHDLVSKLLWLPSLK